MYMGNTLIKRHKMTSKGQVWWSDNDPSEQRRAARWLCSHPDEEGDEDGGQGCEWCDRPQVAHDAHASQGRQEGTLPAAEGLPHHLTELQERNTTKSAWTPESGTERVAKVQQPGLTRLSLSRLLTEALVCVFGFDVITVQWSVSFGF